MPVHHINATRSVLTSVQTRNNIKRIYTASLTEVKLIRMRSDWPSLSPFCQLDARLWKA